MSHFLVIDLGTTYFKFTLFDRSGQLCELETLAPPLERLPSGRLELDAAGFVETVIDGIGRLRQRCEAVWAGIEAVTFATQTNSFVLLDGGDRPLAPLVLWPDRRAEALEDEARQRAGIAGFTAATGVPAVNHQFMIAKLLWFEREMPGIWQRARRTCLISDYLGLLMTGQCVTEAAPRR